MSFWVEKVHFLLLSDLADSQRSAAWIWCSGFKITARSKLQGRQPPQSHNLRPSLNFTFHIFTTAWLDTFPFTRHWKSWKGLRLFHSDSKLTNNLNSNLDIKLMGKSQVPDLPSNHCLVFLSISCLWQFAIAPFCESIQISVLYQFNNLHWISCLVSISKSNL